MADGLMLSAVGSVVRGRRATRYPSRWLGRAVRSVRQRSAPPASAVRRFGREQFPDLFSADWSAGVAGPDRRRCVRSTRRRRRLSRGPRALTLSDRCLAIALARPRAPHGGDPPSMPGALGLNGGGQKTGNPRSQPSRGIGVAVRVEVGRDIEFQTCDRRAGHRARRQNARPGRWAFCCGRIHRTT